MAPSPVLSLDFFFFFSLKSLKSSVFYRTLSLSPSAWAGTRGSLSEGCLQWPAFALPRGCLLVTCEGGVRLGVAQSLLLRSCSCVRQERGLLNRWLARQVSFIFLACLESRHLVIVSECLLPWSSRNFWTDAETEESQLGLGLTDWVPQEKLREGKKENQTLLMTCDIEKND